MREARDGSGSRSISTRVARWLAVAALWLVFASLAAAADTPEDALRTGRSSLDLRYRFEWVDEDGIARRARASTLRLRLGYETGSFRGFSALAEFEGLTVVGSERYNSTANGLTRYPVVADPADEEVNQAYVAYLSPGNVGVRLGRQRITLDNHRFIGNVGWRQLEQTYDAVSVRGDVDSRGSLFYAHLNNANRVFGGHHPVPGLARMDLFADLFHASFALEAGTLVGYAYLLEIENDPGASHKDVGVRFSGRRPAREGIDLLYTAEFADQSDYKSGASTNDASYFFGEVGVAMREVTIRAGYEVLEGNGTYALQTPLATLHAFNGWTDKFLTTPGAGLSDVYASVSLDLRGLRLLVVYHDFKANSGNADYGGELGLLAEKTFRKTYAVSVKYARYEAVSFSRDTQKLWIGLGLEI